MYSQRVHYIDVYSQRVRYRDVTLHPDVSVNTNPKHPDAFRCISEYEADTDESRHGEPRYNEPSA